MFPCALRALGMIRSRGAPLDQAECLRVSEPQDAPLSRPLSSRVSGGRLGPRACVSLSRRPNPPPLRRINLLPTFGGARFVWLVRSSGVTPPVLTRPGVLYQPFNFSFFFSPLFLSPPLPPPPPSVLIVWWIFRASSRARTFFLSFLESDPRARITRRHPPHSRSQISGAVCAPVGRDSSLQ